MRHLAAAIGIRHHPHPENHSGASGGPVRIVLHRDVGALLLLRHARAAGALHGGLPDQERARRNGARGRVPAAAARHRGDVRPAEHPADGIADLRHLHGAGVPHAFVRRHARGPRAGAAQDRGHRRRPDGHRPVFPGRRIDVPGGPVFPDRRQRLLQAQPGDPGRRPVSAGRPAPRPRVQHLLHGREPGSVLRAAGVRNAGTKVRLDVRIRGRGSRA